MGGNVFKNWKNLHLPVTVYICEMVCPGYRNSLSGLSINLMWPRNSERTVKHTQKSSSELSLYSWAGLFEFMPHVVTTRHDLLINHVCTIQFIAIVPKYCRHCCGHYICEEMASHKCSMQTSSKSKPRPFWPVVSARLALDPMLPRPRGSQSAGCTAGQSLTHRLYKRRRSSLLKRSCRLIDNHFDNLLIKQKCRT